MARVKDRFPHWADPETGAVDHDDPTATGPAATGSGCCGWPRPPPATRATPSWAAPLAERLRARVPPRRCSSRFPCTTARRWARSSTTRRARGRSRSTRRGTCARLYAPALRLVPLGAQAEEGAHIGATETSIDSLQAAPFLFWAAGATGDAALREVATNHAETIIHLHLRPDGSFIQSSSLDAATGRLVRHYTHKG